MFNVGDKVILVAATPDNDCGWNRRMNHYVGDCGIVEEVYREDSMEYRVRFEPRIGDDGEELRSYWYCKSEWLKKHEDIPINTEELDSFFSDFGGENNAEH